MHCGLFALSRLPWRCAAWPPLQHSRSILRFGSQLFGGIACVQDLARSCGTKKPLSRHFKTTPCLRLQWKPKFCHPIRARYLVEWEPRLSIYRQRGRSRLQLASRLRTRRRALPHHSFFLFVDWGVGLGGWDQPPDLGFGEEIRQKTR